MTQLFFRLWSLVATSVSSNSLRLGSLVAGSAPATARQQKAWTNLQVSVPNMGPTTPANHGRKKS